MSQRFEIKHKSEALEFAKSLYTEKDVNLVTYEVDQVKINKIVALVNLESDNIAKNLLFIEQFDDFTFKACTLLVLSTINNDGEIVILGIVITGS